MITVAALTLADVHAVAALADEFADYLRDLAGCLLYHLGYDADRAARNLHVIVLYVSRAARRPGAGRALMAATARACRAAGGPTCSGPCMCRTAWQRISTPPSRQNTCGTWTS
jgi:GNAT superfamily N-acetyltransferase